MELSLENKLTELPRLTRWVDERASAERLPEAVARAFHVALLEHVTNIIQYGFDSPGGRTIHLSWRGEGPLVTVEVTDPGRPFDPLQHPPVDLSLPPDERAVGGLGIHLMRTLMDEVQYSRDRDRNRVGFLKRLPR